MVLATLEISEYIMDGLLPSRFFFNPSFESQSMRGEKRIFSINSSHGSVFNKREFEIVLDDTADSCLRGLGAFQGAACTVKATSQSLGDEQCHEFTSEINRGKIFDGHDLKITSVEVSDRQEVALDITSRSCDLGKNFEANYSEREKLNSILDDSIIESDIGKIDSSAIIKSSDGVAGLSKKADRTGSADSKIFDANDGRSESIGAPESGRLIGQKVVAGQVTEEHVVHRIKHPLKNTKILPRQSVHLFKEIADSRKFDGALRESIDLTVSGLDISHSSLDNTTKFLVRPSVSLRPVFAGQDWTSEQVKNSNDNALVLERSEGEPKYELRQAATKVVELTNALNGSERLGGKPVAFSRIDRHVTDEAPGSIVTFEPVEDGVDVRFISPSKELVDLLLRNQDELKASFKQLGLDGYAFSFSNGQASTQSDFEGRDGEGEILAEVGFSTFDADGLVPQNGVDIRI